MQLVEEPRKHREFVSPAMLAVSSAPMTMDDFPGLAEEIAEEDAARAAEEAEYEHRLQEERRQSLDEAGGESTSLDGDDSEFAEGVWDNDSDKSADNNATSEVTTKGNAPGDQPAVTSPTTDPPSPTADGPSDLPNNSHSHSPGDPSARPTRETTPETTKSPNPPSNTAESSPTGADRTASGPDNSGKRRRRRGRRGGRGRRGPRDGGQQDGGQQDGSGGGS